MSGFPVLGAFQKFAGRLRFPQLFLLTFILFVGDLLVPDLIPLIDEILLGLITLMLGTWKQKKSGEDPVTEPVQGKTVEVRVEPLSLEAVGETDSERQQATRLDT